jgi:hypothetical protein
LQISFGMMEGANRRHKKSMLDEIEKIVDFSNIDKNLETLYQGTTGRPPIPPLMLFDLPPSFAPLIKSLHRPGLLVPAMA